MTQPFDDDIKDLLGARDAAINGLRDRLTRAKGIIRRLVEGRWCTCDKCQQAWAEARAFLKGKQ